MSVRTSHFMVGFLSVLLLILILLAPFLDGYLLKRQYLKLILAPNISKEGVKFSVLEYNLGWLSSTAKIAVTLDLDKLSEAKGEPTKNQPHTTLTITLNENISHGPFVYDPISNKRRFALGATETIVRLPAPMEALLGAQVTQFGVAQVSSLVLFNDNYITMIKIPALSGQLPDYGKITWQGLVGNFYLELKDQVIKIGQSEINFGALNVQTPKGSLVLQNILLQYNMEFLPSGLWNGSYVMSTAGLNISAPDNASLQMQDFRLSHLMNVEKNNLVTMATEFSLGKILLPGFSLDQSRFKLNVNQLNGTAWMDLLKEREIFAHQKELTPTQTELLKNKVIALINPNTQISENLILNTSYGRVLSDGKAQWPEPVKKIEDLNNVNFQWNARVSVSLINKLIELSESIQADSPQEITVVAQQPTIEGLNAQVDMWVKEDKLSVYSSIQLKELIKLDLPVDSFDSNIDEIVLKKELTEDMATIIKKRYETIKAGKETVVATETTAPKNIAQDIQKNIDTLVKEGYIRLENDEYVISIVGQKGVVKVNGLDIAGLIAILQTQINNIPKTLPVAETPVTSPVTNKSQPNVITQPAPTPSASGAIIIAPTNTAPSTPQPNG